MKTFIKAFNARALKTFNGPDSKNFQALLLSSHRLGDRTLMGSGQMTSFWASKGKGAGGRPGTKPPASPETEGQEAGVGD